MIDFISLFIHDGILENYVWYMWTPSVVSLSNFCPQVVTNKIEAAQGSVILASSCLYR